MKLLTEGTWYLRSQADERWNTWGRCDCGGFEKPNETEAAIKFLTMKYGKPPADLEWGYMKD